MQEHEPSVIYAHNLNSSDKLARYFQINKLVMNKFNIGGVYPMIDCLYAPPPFFATYFMNSSPLYYQAGEESTELGLASDLFPENGECGGLEINPLKDFMTVDGPNIIYNPT